MATYQELIDDARKARELGDEDLEFALLQRADAVRGSGNALPDSGNYGLGTPMEGIERALSRQKIGAQQFGSDLARILTGVGQPKSDYRKALDYEGERLNAESEKAGLLSRFGESILPMVEFAAIPGPEAFIPRVVSSAGQGALFGLIQPNADPRERATEAIQNAASNVVLPELVGGAARILGGGAKYVRNIASPRYAGAQKIAADLGEAGRGAPPAMPPGAGRGSLPPDGMGPIRPPFAMVEGIRPTAAMLHDDPRVLQLEINARNAPASQGRGKGFYERDMENLKAVYQANAARAMTDKEANRLQDLLNARTGPMREGAFDEIRKRAAAELAANPQAKPQPSAPRPQPSLAIDYERDDIIQAIRKLGGINKASSERILGGQLWEDSIHTPHPVYGPVWRNGTEGQSIDDLARALYEHGYIEAPDPNLLQHGLYAIGQGVIRPGDMLSKYRQNFAGAGYQPQSQHEELMGSLERLIGTMEAKNAPKPKPTQAEPPPLPSYAQPLSDVLDEMQTQAGMRNVPSTQQLARLGRDILQPSQAGELDPADLYALRKLLGDKLTMKGAAFDELSNAARSSRREAMMMKDAIDEGLNGASGGSFADYLAAHREGMAPIEEGLAFQNLVDKFDNGARIPGTTTPEMTRYAYRKGVDDLTYKNLGKAGLADILSPTGRAVTDDSSAALSAMETAKRGPKATIGSDTAAWTAALLRRGLVPGGGGKLGALIDLMDALGASRGAAALDEALLDPYSGKLEELFRLYGDRATPPSPLTQAAKRGIGRGGLADLLSGRKTNKQSDQRAQ